MTKNLMTARSNGGTVYHVIRPYPARASKNAVEAGSEKWKPHPHLWTSVCGGKSPTHSVFLDRPDAWAEVRPGIAEDVKPCAKCRAKYPTLGKEYRRQRFLAARKAEDEHRETELGPADLGTIDALLTIRDVQRQQLARHQAQIVDMIEAACVIKAWVDNLKGAALSPKRVVDAWNRLLRPVWPEPLADMEKMRREIEDLVGRT